MIATAWAAPIAAAVTTAPALAASTCPAGRIDRASWVDLRFLNLEPGGVWAAESTAEFKFSLGISTNGNVGGMSYSSESASVSITVPAFSYTLTSPLDLAFTPPPNWAVTRTTAGGKFLFTFTYTGSPITKPAVTPLGSRPSAYSPDNIFPRVEFPVTIVSTFAVGEVVWVPSSPYTFGAAYDVTYSLSTGSPGCDLSNASYTSTGTIVLTPGTTNSSPQTQQARQGAPSTVDGAASGYESGAA